jgi:hypothetical protein
MRRKRGCPGRAGAVRAGRAGRACAFAGRAGADAVVGTGAVGAKPDPRGECHPNEHRRTLKRMRRVGADAAAVRRADAE